MQAVVLVLVALMAAVKSLRFAPSMLTDFELKRQVKSGKEAAAIESRLRRDRPLLLAFKQLIVLLLTIIIIVCLRSAYGFVVAILWAVFWLVMVEFICARRAFCSFVEDLADQCQPQLLRLVDRLQPALKLVADKDTRHPQQATVYSKEELLYALEHDHGVLSKDELLLVRHALNYYTYTIKDVMMPRLDVVAVEPKDTVGPLLLDRLHKSGWSYFPVVKKDLSHAVGILSLRAIVPPRPAIKIVADAMDPGVAYLNEAQPLDALVAAFLQTKQYLFIVVNEFEETTGVITIEMLLERLVGAKTTDEFDRYEDLRAVATYAATARDKSTPSRSV